eukprot:5822048-Pleurochrysis_carterae.AAC.1
MCGCATFIFRRLAQPVGYKDVCAFEALSPYHVLEFVVLTPSYSQLLCALCHLCVYPTRSAFMRLRLRELEWSQAARNVWRTSSSVARP